MNAEIREIHKKKTGPDAQQLLDDKLRAAIHEALAESKLTTSEIIGVLEIVKQSIIHNTLLGG